MNQFEFIYPVIDAKRTGVNIKKECRKQGFTAKRLQHSLGLGAIQSIYDWFSGRTLPSLDNLLAISRLLGVPMEKLIICREEAEKEVCCPVSFFERVLTYWKGLFRISIYCQYCR